MDSGAALAAFLGGKRWFGSKGRQIRDAALVDVIPVKWPNGEARFAVARARVTTDEAASVYQLFLPGDGAMAEALDDETFRRGLADAFQAGATFEGDGVRWVIESEGKKALVVPAGVPVTLSKSEQSNSSLLIDKEAILKLYRKLERGVHPDVEVTRFLTVDRAFPHVPVLLGTIRFEDRAGATIAGMLQELVPGAVDGWSYALASAEQVLADRAKPPAVPFEREANQLGVVTRALHEELASGDRGSAFEFTRASADDLRRWAGGATNTVDKALMSLERAIEDDLIPRAQAQEARTLRDARERYGRRLADITASIASDAGANVRTHGDYHLGQVLRSAAAQFLVIDFEGEPARPLAERRGRHSPLRDVAGMLRSFAYAAAMAGKTVGATAERSREWEASARQAFLRGYFSERQGQQGLLPRAERSAESLIALFEAEKVFYELEYEIDHRPDWTWIPMRGIAALFT